MHFDLGEGQHHLLWRPIVGHKYSQSPPKWIPSLSKKIIKHYHLKSELRNWGNDYKMFPLELFLLDYFRTNLLAVWIH